VRWFFCRSRHGICIEQSVLSELASSKPLAHGSIVDRAFALFWCRVARELALAALFSALLVALALGAGRASLGLLFGGYVLAYATLILAAVGGAEKRSNGSLQRAGMDVSRPTDSTSAGHSTPLR
jgi:hypothetical protein